eukprot:TRINITY_DN7518_c0_g1_i1.p1 TRINITY_DN7518_c0_g1~~TRINITY_DN7518_c0_g1_i1.p1  ORF type:complete len:149 (+),score=0.98 TRINITY_DN7518_c0_g1_i1:60-506(+)
MGRGYRIYRTHPLASWTPAQSGFPPCYWGFGTACSNEPRAVHTGQVPCVLFSIIEYKSVKISALWMVPNLDKLAIGMMNSRLGRVGLGHIEEVVVHFRPKIYTIHLRGLSSLKYIHLIWLSLSLVRRSSEEMSVMWNMRPSYILTSDR